MAHIVIATNGLRGLLNASLALARRLQADGHRLTCAATIDVAASVEAHGFAYSQLPDSMAARERAVAADAADGAGYVRKWRRLTQRRAAVLDAMAAPTLQRALRAWRADLLLIDVELHELIMVARADGARIGLLQAWMSTWPHGRMPPLHRSDRPGHGWTGHASVIRAQWLRHRLRTARVDGQAYLRSAGLSWPALLHAFADAVGFDRRRHVDAGLWQIPFGYRDMPIGILHARELDFPAPVPAYVRYLGPMIDRDRPESGDAAAEQACTVALQAIRARGQRLIYGGFGSMFTAERGFIERLFAAMAARADWALVLSLGGQRADDLPAGAPDNVHVLPWVPQLRVLAEADAALQHGGINTLEECIELAVPAVVYSGGFRDMPGSAARIAHHGLGAVGDRHKDSPATIVARLAQVMTSAAIRRNLSAMRRVTRRYEQERVAEQWVASLLRRP